MLYGTLFVALKCAWIAQISGLFAIGLGKVAAVAFLLSVQGPTFLKKRVFLIALAAINVRFKHSFAQRSQYLVFLQVAIDVACAFEIAFHCSPPEALWNATIGTCHNPNRNLALGYFPGSWNAASDLTLATYPIVLFWKLQMKRLHKVGFCLLFGLGAFAGVCSAIKTWQVHAILIAQDPAESINGLLIWTFTEMWIVLILTSVAPLWPLIRKIGSKLGSICSSERGHVQPHDDVELRNRQQSGVTSREAFTGGNDFVKLADTLNPEEGISMQRDVHVHREPVANSNCEDTSAFTNGRQAIQPASYV